MGGSSKKVTVGYRYYLGIHMILCHGPIDRLRKILVDGKTAWQGDYAGGRININGENLFGGESREGGVSGAVDIEMGGPSQGVNDYLAGQLGSDIPAFRGVVGAVLRQCYLGINPYLKKWAFLAQRIHTRQNGVAQWYDAKAQIGSLWKEPQAIYMALDYSGSMAVIMGNGKTRLENLMEAANATIDYINDLRNYSGVRVDLFIQKWGGSTSGASYLDLSDASAASAKAFVSSPGYLMGTDFRLGVAAAPGFFASALSSARRTSIFATDGEPDPSLGPEWQQSSSEEAAATLLGISGLSSYCFNIDEENTHYTELLDNSSADGVPVLDGSDPDTMKNALVFALSGQLDLNPAHIIRECLTDPDWGMGYQEADVDDASFVAAADTLFAEGFGLSFIWDRQTPIEDFVREVVRHIQASLYVDRTTGKFALKLIRADYDIEDLLLLDESNVEKVDGFSRPSFGDMINSVTVNYWDSDTYKTASISAQDTALIQMQGAVIGTTIQYPGCTGRLLASKLATRDLRTLSTPLLSCTVYANRQAAGLNVGDAFLLHWPDYMDAPTVMRVIGLALGDGKTNKVKITCTEDAFSFPEVPMVVPEEPSWEDPSQVPTAATYRAVVEAPYYELVQRLGQTTCDEQLAANQDVGYLLASAAAPAGAINARLAVDAGAGYDGNDTPMDFCPSAFLVQDVRPGDTDLVITGGQSLSAVVVGSHAQIGDELVKVVSVSASLLVVGRGVLDTVPAAHASGSVVLFWDAYADSDGVEYVSGESVSVKMLPVSGAGQLALSLAPVDMLTFVSRALRPYPPGKLLVGGASYPVAIGGVASLSLAWSHRDRLQQTAGELQDTTVGDIGPEAGTTYNLRVYGESGALLREVLNAGTSHTYAAEDEAADSEIPAAGGDYVFSATVSMLHFNGTDGSTSIVDERGVSWTAKGTAKLSTAQSKFGGASLLLDSDLDPNWNARVLLLHFDGENDSTDVLNSYVTTPANITNGGCVKLSTAHKKFGQSSGYFDGVASGNVNTGASANYTLGSGDFTIELWAKPATDCPTCYLLSNGTSFASGVWILEPTHATNPGKWCFFAFGIAATGLPLASTSDALTDTWTHVAVTRKGNTMRLFINGVIEDTYTASGSIDTGTTNTLYMDGSAGRYKGYVDEVAVHKGVCLYEANFTPRTRPYRDIDSGDHIETGTITSMALGTDDFTFEGFVRPTVQSDRLNPVLYDARDLSLAVPKSISMYLRSLSGALYMAVTSADGLVINHGGSAVPLNAWSHFAFVRTSGTLKAYLNGVLQWSLAYNYDVGSSYKVRIGTSKVSMSALVGYLDEVRLVKLALYSADFTPPAAQYPDASGGFRLNGRLRVTLESERGEVLSLQKHDYTVLREGYGFNYGELYGGA